MANITIRHVSRRVGGDRLLTRVEGEIAIVGRNNAYPPGSFGLRTVHEVYFPSSYTARRALIGSASGVVKASGVSNFPTIGNNVVIIPVVMGSTGTRLATLATIGSAFPTGTVISAFVAIGQ